MNLKRLTLFVLSVSLGSVSTSTHAQLASISTTAAVVSTSCAEFSEQTTPTGLAQEIAQVELERVLLGVRYTEDHPVFADLNEKQLGLEPGFTQLQPTVTIL